jgi:hypothetical protein
VSLISFINALLGLRILKWITKLSDIRITSTFVNTAAKRLSGYITEIKILIDRENLRATVFQRVRGVHQFVNCGINLAKPVFRVSVLSEHVLPQEIVERFSGRMLMPHSSLKECIDKIWNVTFVNSGCPQNRKQGDR